MVFQGLLAMSVGAYNRRWYLNSQDRGQAGVGGGGGVTQSFIVGVWSALRENLYLFRPNYVNFPTQLQT